jgi:hypothetical protein
MKDDSSSVIAIAHASAIRFNFDTTISCSEWIVVSVSELGTPNADSNNHVRKTLLPFQMKRFQVPESCFCSPLNGKNRRTFGHIRFHHQNNTCAPTPVPTFVALEQELEKDHLLFAKYWVPRHQFFCPQSF